LGLRLTVIAAVIAMIPQDATAQSAQVASIRTQIQANSELARQIIGEIRRVQAEKERVLAELRTGHFCSECRRSKSQIEQQERVPFAKHLADVRGRPVPMSKEELDKVAADFDEHLSRLHERYRELERQTRQLDMQASKIDYDQRMAKFKADQELARQQQEKLQQELRARQEKIAAEFAETNRQIQEGLKLAADKRDQERQSRLEAQIRRQQADAQQLRLEQERQNALYTAQARAVPKPEFSEELKKMAWEIQSLGGAASSVTPLTPQQKAEQARLQEMANQGLVSAPPSFDIDGIQVAADNTASAWNRLVDIKDAGQGALNAFERVVTNDVPNAFDRAKLVVENAADTAKLTDRVTSQLPSAVDALLAGDYEKADRVQAKLDRATGEFAASADERARKASPAVDAAGAAYDLRSTIDTARTPLTPPANDQERLANYIKAAKSAYGMAEYDPQKNGAGPLGQDAPRLFHGGVYTVKTHRQPLELYRVAHVVNGKTVNYWSPTPPSAKPGSGADGPAPATFKIVLPAGFRVFEGRTTAGDPNPLIFIDDFDPAWVRH